LRIIILLAAALILSSSPAWALGGSGSVVVDIVGSKTDDTRIMSSGIEKVELEIIGSEANNTTIGSPEKQACQRHHRGEKSDDREEIAWKEIAWMMWARADTIPGMECTWESTPGTIHSGTGTRSTCPNGRSFK